MSNQITGVWVELMLFPVIFGNIFDNQLQACFRVSVKFCMSTMNVNDFFFSFDYLLASKFWISLVIIWNSELQFSAAAITLLRLCWGLKLHKMCPGYDSKQFHGKASVMMELWGMQSNLSLPSLPALFWAEEVASDRVLSIDQIEQFDI